MTTAIRPTAATWGIDPTHTDVAFAVRHMGLSTVRGRFDVVAGTIRTDDAGVPSEIRVELDTDSIVTGSADRDGHLRSADFFDAERHPKIVFESRDVRPKGGDRYEIVGDLDMHGVRNEVVLDAEIGEPIRDPFGLVRRAASASAKIDRKAWDLSWNQVLEAGALLVSEEVRITLDVQATQQD